MCRRSNISDTRNTKKNKPQLKVNNICCEHFKFFTLSLTFFLHFHILLHLLLFLKNTSILNITFFMYFCKYNVM